MTELGDVLELLQARRRQPVELNSDYLVRATLLYGQPSSVETVARLRASEPGWTEPVVAVTHWSRPPVDLGSIGFVVDLTPAIAACSVSVDGDATVAGRLGWQMVLRETVPPLTFPRRAPEPLSLFPYPNAPAVWNVVIDKEVGVVLSLSCRVGSDVVGSIEMLLPGSAPPPPVEPPEIPAACRAARISVDGLLVAYMKEFSDQCHLTIESRDVDAARAAAESACEAICRVPNPEPPGGPLPSFISDIEAEPGGVSFWFDMADAEAYDGLVEHVLARVLEAMAASGLHDARLTYRDDFWDA